MLNRIIIDLESAMYPSDLTDAQWKILSPPLVKPIPQFAGGGDRQSRIYEMHINIDCRIFLLQLSHYLYREADIGDIVAIHDIDVKPVHSALHQFLDLPPHFQKAAIRQ